MTVKKKKPKHPEPQLVLRETTANYLLVSRVLNDIRLLASQDNLPELAGPEDYDIMTEDSKYRLPWTLGGALDFAHIGWGEQWQGDPDDSVRVEVRYALYEYGVRAWNPPALHVSIGQAYTASLRVRNSGRRDVYGWIDTAHLFPWSWCKTATDQELRDAIWQFLADALFDAIDQEPSWN